VTDGEPLPQVPVTCENPEEWGPINASRPALASGGNVPTMTLEGVQQLVSVGVPAMFAADATGDFSTLPGLFSDGAIGVLSINRGTFAGKRPHTVTVRLVGYPHDHAAEPHLRIHVQIEMADSAGQDAEGQFWDIAQNVVTTTTKPVCPSCGAPTEPGAVVCRFCGADVRSVSNSPLMISKLQLY
jgi:hypothetical protein